MTKRKANKRPCTMAEAIEISLSEAEQAPTVGPLEEIHASHATLPSQATEAFQAPQSQPRQPTQPSSNDLAPKTSKKNCGRGSAKGMKKWGTGVKLHVIFNEDYKPLGDEGTKLIGQLGIMVRNPHRVPLTYLDWNVVPEDIKSTIWKEIEDNVEDCPKEFQPVAMRACNKLWKDHKSKTKTNFYVKQKEDPNIQLKVPRRVLPDQWVELVSYWKTDEAKAIALRNSINREWHGPAHRTGRTSFAQIRHEMSALGEETDKMSVFTKTRDANDLDVQSIVKEFKDYLAQIPEPLQTTEVRNDIFHKVLGEDGHGYCKTYGAGVPRSAVYGQSSGPSHPSSSTFNEITRQVNEATQGIEQRLTVEIEQRLTGEIEKKLTGEIEQRLRGEIEKRVTGEIERKLDDMFMAHLARVGAQMSSFESVGGTNGTGQGLNVARRQPSESVGDDIQDGEQDVSPLLTRSPRLDEQEGQKVILVSYTIPKYDVAEGIVISKDPLIKVGGKPLGSDFWKVLVKKAKRPNASLERPRKKIRTVADAVGYFVAWRSCDAFVEGESEY